MAERDQLCLSTADLHLSGTKPLPKTKVILCDDHSQVDSDVLRISSPTPTSESLQPLILIVANFGLLRPPSGIAIDFHNAGLLWMVGTFGVEDPRQLTIIGGLVSLGTFGWDVGRVCYSFSNYSSLTHSKILSFLCTPGFWFYSFGSWCHIWVREFFVFRSDCDHQFCASILYGVDVSPIVVGLWAGIGVWFGISSFIGFIAQ